MNVVAVNRWTLGGKTALVTGATRGIGKAIAEELAQLGASVYVCARSEEEVKLRLQEWKDAGLSNISGGCACDVSSYPSCERLMAQVSNHFQGKLHILIHNAARIGNVMPTMDVPVEDMALTMRTNFESGVLVSRLAHPLLKASGAGSIIFISSIAGSLAGGHDTCIYHCSKGALNQLTRSLAFEWAKDGIRVNGVAPGYIFTEMARSLGDHVINTVQNRIPLRRYGELHEIAAAVAFLCMPCSGYTTGLIMTVDGGMTCHHSFAACPNMDTT